MKNEELKSLLQEGESERLEFKTSLKLIDKIGETISAFSNSAGGIVLIGLSDKGSVLGVTIGANTLEELANYIKRNTDPPVYPSIKVESLESKQIILIEIIEHNEKPVFFKGHAYKRVGRSSPQLTSSEIRKLAKESGEKVYWDWQICPRAVLDDIDWVFIKDFFIPRYESLSKNRLAGNLMELLEALNCIRDNKPTNAGIVLFGRNPQKFFINAYIAVARYKGDIESTERLDYKEFVGNVFNQIDSCDKYIKEHISIMSRLLPHQVEREDIPEYCWFSVRELITNTVCHRDYSDQGSKVIIKIFDGRIEYFNPGGLPSGITAENITEKQYSRNPVIANCLAKIKYIEEVGEGWNKIIEEHRRHPLEPKPPKINADSFSVLVAVYSTREKFEKGNSGINERQKNAIEHIRRKKKITNKEYQLINKTTKKTATRDLQGLIKKGIFIKIGRTGKGVYYTLDNIYKGDIRGHKGT